MSVHSETSFPFLPKQSAVARLIAEFDWSATSVGAISEWPAHLRAMVSFMLSADVSMVLLWGKAGVMIYNDAYADFASTRHPFMLGQDVAIAWPELADFNQNVLDVVLSGRSLAYRDHHMVVDRSGSPEDVWLNIDYSPVRDETGSPIGGIGILKDTTARVRIEQRLRIAQEAGGVGTFEWYPETGHLDVSDEYRRIWGLEIGENVTDALLMGLLHPEDRVQSGVSKLTEDNPLDYTEYRRLDPLTGDLRWIARRGEVLSTPGSGKRRFVGIAFDITARKAAETALRESEAKWRGLFEQMHEGFFLGAAIRDEQGKMYDFQVLEANPAFEKQSGLPRSHALGSTMRTLAPDVPEDLIEAYARVADGGRSEQIEVHIPSLEDRWFEARARFLGDGLFAVLFVDISARKATERLVVESEARFRSLAQSMPNHVWTARADGALDWFNDRVYAYAGQPDGSLGGGGWESIIHPDDLSSATEAWEQARRAEVSYSVEFRLRRHDGQYRWYISRAVPIRCPNGIVERWIGTNTDIEDQKAAERALADFALKLEERVAIRTAELAKTQDALRQSQKMESIGNLTGGVAHDFNNLLQVVSGNLQLLAGDIVGNERAERRVRNALEGVSRGARLASQLLAFGRRQPLAPKVINLGRLLRNMDELLRRAIGEAVDVETIVAGGLWNILIDPSNVENALLNLAINGRDAMDGQGKLTIEAGNAYLDADYARAHDEVVAGQYVLLAVSDTGTGMSQETLEKVFEPFFSTKPEGKGTGLGLSMVYGFVKQSGGHVKIYSELGHGTTIKLYLPRSDQAEDVLTDTGAGPVVGGTETILVVEDDNAVRETVIALLGDLGYRVLKAHDADSALAVIESGVPIDLLFTDVVMPGNLKSKELARKAVERLPHLGVLFTSGYTENSIVHGGRLDKDVELLSKPYTREALARKVRHILANVAQSKQVPIKPVEAQTKSGEAAPLTILVCEDEILIRMITVDMLEDCGHTVIEAGDAKSALEALAKHPIDILFTDVGLPDMSGVILAERARSLKPGLPVIFATGHSHLEGVEPSAATQILVKPYGEAALTKVLARMFGK